MFPLFAYHRRSPVFAFGRTTQKAQYLMVTIHNKILRHWNNYRMGINYLILHCEFPWNRDQFKNAVYHMNIYCVISITNWAEVGNRDRDSPAWLH